MATATIMAPRESLANANVEKVKQTKPMRAMTYPRRETKPQGARRAKSGAVDAEELTRRLQVLYAEQKDRAERRRNTQAKDKENENEIYHHVPSVAAAAFERTATPSDATRGGIHKLSQVAVKHHLAAAAAANAETNGASVPTIHKTLALDQARQDREMLGHRNQFQWTHDLELAEEADLQRNLYKPPQRTFAEFAHLRRASGPTAHTRPMSTGDILEQDHYPARKPSKVLQTHDANDRSDWTQRDEPERQKGKERSQIRKRDSIWMLGKKEKTVKEDKVVIKDDILPTVAEKCSAPEGGKSKRGLFSLFKRQATA